MKQRFLLKTMLLLFVLVVGSSSVWAGQYTYTLSSGANGFYTDSELTTHPGSSSSNKISSFYASDGKQFIASAANIYFSSANSGYLFVTGGVTLTLPTYSNEKITSISLSNSSGCSTAVKVSIVSGENTASAEQTWSTQSSTYNYTIGNTYQSSTLGIKVTTTNKNAQITQIVINTASEVDNRTATTVTINASGITHTNKFVGTAAGSLAAIVKAGEDEIGGASVTWSSDTESVATIDSSTGAVTLVGEGTTTITASFAGNATYKPSSNTYELTVTNENPALVNIWSENFSGYDADDVPSGGTYSYSCTNGGGTTKIYADSNAGGTSPELLVGKSSGTFTVTIPLRTSTYGYSGDLKLSFKSNAYSVKVKTTTDGITVDGEASAGEGLTFNTKDTHKVTFKGVTTSTDNITIVFTTTTDKNVRIDDVVLKGVQEALTQVATPTISPASGAVASGTEVTITCLTDGATIYYTTDGTTPTSGSTAYNPASKPAITAATTIKAIGVKDGLTDSEVATASYTIAAPCATPTFLPAAGEVAKGTTVAISCDTDGATIYYTTDGTDPTTSSTVYSSAIIINSAMTIKAIAAKEGNANSAIATADYTVIDYATLPFSYDENGLGELPVGLSQGGLTGKYDSSPKMKFDTTGDYLILKINEAPGTLSFDILGNGFSGGTFTVQTSADGAVYSDLKEYTSLGAKTTERFVLAGTVRYIKWVYTTKSSGNVALGNINLTTTGTITIASACTDGSKYYGTFYTDRAYVMPENLTGQSVSIDGEGKLAVNNDYTAGNVVPAGTPLLIQATAGGNYTVNFTDAAGSAPASNNLKGTITAVENTTGDDCKFYRLTMHNGTQIGFYYGAANGAAFTPGANKAYLAVPNTVTAPEYLWFNTETTGIDNVNRETITNDCYYNLNGQRVAQPTKGLYIVNGRKVVIK